jgi:hypothetical protein
VANPQQTFGSIERFGVETRCHAVPVFLTQVSGSGGADFAVASNIEQHFDQHWPGSTKTARGKLELARNGRGLFLSGI